MDVISVSACVQAVISAFQDAVGLVRQIKAKEAPGQDDDKTKLQISELETSLDLGPPIVQGQYDSDFRKFGETYARGDGIAREQLKDVLITLQMAVISNLTGVWMGTKSLDAMALLAASDESRVNAVSGLIQWQQRLASAAAAQQQQRSASYHMSPGSRGMTPPLTTASSYSGRSDGVPSYPLTPEEQAERSANWIAQTYPAMPSPGPPPQPMPPANYMQSISPMREDNNIPSPMTGNARLPLHHQQSIISSNGSETPPLPYRYPHRPSISTPAYPQQHEQMVDQYGQLISPVSTQTSPDYRRLSAVEIGPSPPGTSRSPDYLSPPSSRSQPVLGMVPNLPPMAASRMNPSAHLLTAHPNSNMFELPAGEPTSPGHYLPPRSADRQLYERRGSQPGPPPASSPQPLPQSPPLQFPLQPHISTQASAQSRHPIPPPFPGPPPPPPKNRPPNDRKPLPTQAPPIASATTSGNTSPVPQDPPPLPARPRAPSTSPPTYTPGSPGAYTPSAAPTFPPPPMAALILPTDANNYLGFCKGAFKLQCALPPKKCFNIETRPSGLYSTFQVWRCSKCSFEGPLSILNPLPAPGQRRPGKPEKIFDQRLRTSSSGGIQYRWAFLAKSHVRTTDTVNGVIDGSFGTFGCLFCCAEGPSRGWNAGPSGATAAGAGALGPMGTTTTITAGPRLNGASTAGTNPNAATGGAHHHHRPVGALRGLSMASVTSLASGKSSPAPAAAGAQMPTNATPMFGNVEAFMQHLEMHRVGVGQPGPEMQRRMKCVVGRVGGGNEEFDVNLLPMDEGTFRG